MKSALAATSSEHAHEDARTRDAASPNHEHAHEDARTRDRVARALHEHGPQSAGALSASFGLTAAAVRRHLDALIAAGLVVEAPERPVRGKIRGRGRPAKLFTLTDAGRSSFGHAYDDIASAALRYLRDTGGEGALHDFAQQRVAGLEARYTEQLAAAPASRRPALLAELLSTDGYAASVEQAGTGVQVCQHHCPVAHVAAEFPQLCEAETQAFGRMLGTHVQRLATIAHGDGVCTTHIPQTGTASGPDRQGSTSTQIHEHTTTGKVLA